MKDISKIKEVRSRSSMSIAACKTALQASDGNVEKALDRLRKMSGRPASDFDFGEKPTPAGYIDSYVHNGRIGVMIEVESQTDFATRSDKFRSLVKDLCLHIAGAGPQFVSESDVPLCVAEQQRAEYRQQAASEGKPEAIIEKIVDGKLKKHYGEVCLLNQPFVKDSDRTVKNVLDEAMSVIGENIVVKRFVRFDRG